MPGTELSSGGRVEHEVFMWERVIVFLIEVKLEVMTGPKYGDFLAQVMCELECSYSSSNFRCLLLILAWFI
jgi:hypothetical protein